MARSKLNVARDLTQKATVLLGDARAVQTGRIGPRVANRLMGKLVGRVLRGLWR